MLKVSVITVCYNSEKYIETAIQSVISQDYNDIEYIIVDGKSTDSTLEIIKKYKDQISTLISEPDLGIYDAMNKGIRMSTGDIVAFLNSDDLFASPSSLSRVVKIFDSKNVDCVYADIEYVNSCNVNKVVRTWRTGAYSKEGFKSGWHPAHPAFYVKKNIYDKNPHFNLKFKLAADFELMLRFVEIAKITMTYLPVSVVKMRVGGATNKNLKNILNQNFECINAFHLNGIDVTPFYTIKRLFSKLMQHKS